MKRASCHGAAPRWHHASTTPASLLIALACHAAAWHAACHHQYKPLGAAPRIRGTPTLRAWRPRQRAAAAQLPSNRPLGAFHSSLNSGICVFVSTMCSKRRLSKSGKFCRFVPDTRLGTNRDAAVRPLRAGPGGNAAHGLGAALSSNASSNRQRAEEQHVPRCSVVRRR